MKPTWVLIVSLCIVAAAAAFAAGKSTAPEVVQAQRFELVDADGVTLDHLGVTDLELYDAEAKKVWSAP